MHRRILIKLPALMAAANLLSIHEKARAIDPPTLSILLGLITAVGNFYSAKVTADKSAVAQIEGAKMQVAIEKMRQEFEIKKMRYQMGSSAVWQDAAFDGGGEADALLSSNIDGRGTEFGVSGRLASRRGQYEGAFSTVEAARFAYGVERGRPMPVPVEGGYHALSTEQVEALQQFVGRDNSIIGGRFYSSARVPTRDGWDIETIIYANSNNVVNSVVVPRPARHS